MTTQSRKSKGRTLQKLVRDKLLTVGNLEGNDVQSRSMGATGEDVILSPLAKQTIGNLYIECKNVEKMNPIKVFIEVAEKNKGVPVVVYKKNRIKPIVILDLDYWVELLKVVGGKK